MVKGKTIDLLTVNILLNWISRSYVHLLVFSLANKIFAHYSYFLMVLR